MVARWPYVGLAVTLLAPPATSPAAEQPAPRAPEQQQAEVETPKRLGRRYPAPLRAGRAGAPPREEEAANAASKRLGRMYPAPVPSPVSKPREEPRVYVSVVSPRPSGVHQRTGRQRTAGQPERAGVEPLGGGEMREPTR